MKRLSLEAKGGQWLADLASWERESAPDNREQLERLRRNLRLARQQALTDRQRQMRAVHNCPGRDGCLMPAGAALERVPSANRVVFRTAAFRADKAVWKPKPE